jgi:hypothetical protein
VFLGPSSGVRIPEHFVELTRETSQYSFLEYCNAHDTTTLGYFHALPQVNSAWSTEFNSRVVMTQPLIPVSTPSGRTSSGYHVQGI